MSAPIPVPVAVHVPFPTSPAVGPHSVITTCPSCHISIKTRTVHNATTKTHTIACILCLCLCWLCVCCPYCMNSCRNTNHYCPNCDAFIGTYQS